MDITVNPSSRQLAELFVRNIPEDDADLEQSVRAIIDDVRRNGDEALKRLARQFDKADPDTIEVSRSRLEQAADEVSPEVLDAMRKAAANIASFHKAQLVDPIVVETQPGVTCVQRQVAIPRVGLYIPGGRAPLFSTVLMLAVPARLAGCREVVLCTPAGAGGHIAPEILAAAAICKVDRVFAVGGAQAIAAMAYGTESVPRVNKIFGPGNRYVTKAKQLVSLTTAIDMPAGPSEVMVMADDEANPSYVAADLLSQAEHGPDSQSVLLCLSEKFAHRVIEQVDRLRLQLSRADCIDSSLAKSHIIVLPDRRSMIDAANLYAPEHLIIAMRDASETASFTTEAGSVFIGDNAPESAGDYASGTNHTLPTGGWASALSGVNTDSFMRRVTYQTLTRDGLRLLAPVITSMARAEGLDAHALAVTIRIENED
ncbi:MAG: histidinol dehydrogenase [Muribaculaceae bacterium]|nr:histidinol dehydrogenase [Muribaculaceae bacterium]